MRTTSGRDDLGGMVLDEPFSSLDQQVVFNGASDDKDLICVARIDSSDNQLTQLVEKLVHSELVCIAHELDRESGDRAVVDELQHRLQRDWLEVGRQIQDAIDGFFFNQASKMSRR